MKKTISWILIGIGIGFLLYAIAGRYIVIPGYLLKLEEGVSGIPKDVNVWLVVRYMVWAFAFKLGIFFLMIGAVVRNSDSALKNTIFIVGGILYIGTAYAPIPAPASIFFGIGGTIITICTAIMILSYTKSSTTRIALSADFKLAAIFFIATASYNLCPLLGVRTFALQPDKMIRYGLQSDAQSIAVHIMIELALGWIFLALSHWPAKEK